MIIYLADLHIQIALDNKIPKACIFRLSKFGEHIRAVVPASSNVLKLAIFLSS